MLLLHRRRNECVVITKDGAPQEPIVVRVVEVLPTGDITLGFTAKGYSVVRSEIYNSGFKQEETQMKSERGKMNGYKTTGYYP